MINARFDIALTADDVTNLGMTILKTERAFNIAAGFTSQDDRLPEFFKEEPIAPHNVVWDISDQAIDSFWDFCRILLSRQKADTIAQNVTTMVSAEILLVFSLGSL